MQSCERIRRIIDHQPVDRIGLYESFWWETVADWFGRMPSLDEIEDAFGLDAGMVWFDQSFLLPPSLIEEDDDARVVVDEWGAQLKEFKDHQSTPGHIGFSLQNRAQWRDDYRARLIYDPSRIDWEMFTVRHASLRQKGRFIALSVLDPFECTLKMVGSEQQLVLMAENPEWLVEMFDAHTALVEAAFEEICGCGLKPDALWIYGDIAYRAGMLFSPRMYRELLLPFHRRYCELAHRHGCQVIYHSDGDVTGAIPLLLEAGIDCLHPLEVKAGVDLVALKKQYGEQLALIGNIDARLFQANDLPALEAEIRTKVSAAMQGSGYIFHSDHSIPPGTRRETYAFARELALEVGRYHS